MLGRIVLCHASVCGRLRDAATIHRAWLHNPSLKASFKEVRHGIRLNQSVGRRSRDGIVFRLGLGLLSGASVKLLLWKSPVCCEASQPNLTHVGDDVARFDWGKFWLMLKPYVWHLLAALGSALLVALLNIRIPLELGRVINVMTKAMVSSNAETLTKLMVEPASQLFLLYGAQAFFTFMYIHLLSCVGERVAASMKLQLFSSILSQDLEFFDRLRTGDIVSRLTVDIQDFKSSFKMCISQGVRSITQIFGCGVSLFLISPQMAGGMLLVVPGVILIGTALGSLLRRLSQAAQVQAGKATLTSEEAISNIRTVRAFAMEPGEYEMFSEEVQKSCRLNEQLGFGIGLFQGGTNLFLNGLVLGTLYVGGKLMAVNQLAPGDLMAFLVATQTIQRSLSQLSLLFGHMVKGMAAGARVFELINLKPLMPLTGGKRIPFHSFLGDVKFLDVSFAYPTRPEQEILKHFFLRLAPGNTVAIVGTSGNGKSTIAALLERFYDINEGSITIDGVDIRELDPSWLRGKAIGFINQEPVLFAASIMENIRYGRPDATDEEVIEVAKLANADGFIQKFPRGYSTIVGERGVAVSGGQKQRIAIARALLKNPSILILDEATSALDAESEKLVQNALDKLTRGRTVLVIAHRLSTVRNADCIVVLNNGVIVEMGTHNYLFEKKGFYWNLFRQQQLHQHSRSQA